MDQNRGRVDEIAAGMGGIYIDAVLAMADGGPIAHPPIAPYKVRVADHDHELVRDIAEFETDDELYLSRIHGDLHMLQWVAQQSGPSLSLLVHHTDAEREYQYNKHTDKVLPLAKQEGWTVIDMKNDWKTVFLVSQR